jgi:hypothetical protein
MKAFPSTEPVYKNDVIGVKQSSGMDLRDYFAAEVLSCITIDETNIHSSADFCYAVADAMMESREN